MAPPSACLACSLRFCCPLPHPTAGGSAYPHEGGKGVGGGNGDVGFSLTPDMVDRKIEEALEKLKKDMPASV